MFGRQLIIKTHIYIVYKIDIHGALNHLVMLLSLTKHIH